jgi:hypothetical protein
MFRNRRTEFTKDTKRQAFARSGGICECHLIPELRRPDGCGIVLRPGHINYEHIHQDALGGSNDISNCCVLARNCWREKTDTIDLPLIAKSNRQSLTQRAASEAQAASTAEAATISRKQKWTAQSSTERQAGFYREGGTR